MTSVDECRARFDAAREAFEVEEGQPTENYITKVVEAICGVLYTLRYDVEKGRDNLVGIIIDDPTYVKKFGQTFRRPARPSVYDDSITGEKVTVTIRKAEAVWKAKIQDWDLYDTAEEESSRFITDSVEDVWLTELKKKITVYAEVKAITMIDHLRKTCLGTHEIDILALQDQMREMHLKLDTVPEYIENMEKAQEQSDRAENKISNAMMVNIATKAMLSTERFPKTNDDWEDLPKAERTWARWKTMYRKADNKDKVKKKARDAQFGGLAKSTALSATVSQPSVRFDQSDTKKEPVTLEELEGCFDAIATAAVTGKDSIESLTKTNAVLTKTNAELAAVIKSLASSGGGRRNQDKKGTGGGGGRPDKPDRQAKWCPNCKRDTWHDPDDCFELGKNKDNRPKNWKSVFDKN